jgi:hypothetical protein
MIMCNKKSVSSLMLFLLMIFMSLPALSEKGRSLFDHFNTSFPLTGLHIDVDCSACHLNGVFKGTPQECSVCHNGVRAVGKHVGHVQSDNNCDNCHTTFSMSDARFEHDNITAPCSSCHNGVTAIGKSVRHVTTSQECDACHTTASWLNVRFDHSLVTGPCSSCHNGSRAEGKPANHIITSQECDSCHATNTWLNARIDHSFITGSCSSCHNNVTASGKPSDHAVTSDDCTRCHTTTSWSRIIFTHSSIADHNSSVSCTDCHIGNNYALSPWQFPGYAPDCAACHADDYKQDSHKKTEQPNTIFYTVDQLRDCAGSCHLYENDSFTNIKDARSGEHQINASQF